MAYTATGVSVQGFQRVVNFQTFQLAYYVLEFTAAPTGPLQRVGYGYIQAVDINTPFQTRLLSRDAIYMPGTYILAPGNYGYSAVKYTVDMEWNVPGIAWRVIAG